ncbi:hypothetical protein [Motiliproteus sp. SC1-56]|uniref:hypothetical protein n=1 Tax=Motiliproteus sp. SC1-56 TaxID=2799565 RepID=UPI001A901F05|nr:hypothetical protein [Motiliproteus sp. SC1-56]
MQRLSRNGLVLALATLGLSTTLNAETIKECYNNVCASLETDSCVAETDPLTLKVEGALEGSGSFNITAYQVLRDATWRYNANHQVVVDEGEVVDAKGFLFADSFAKHYEEKEKRGSKYTFVFGSRNFGHGFYDVAVETEVGAGVAAGGAALPIDVKPGACPNPLNAGQKGVLPVAILGHEGFDLKQIDPASITLAGVPALRYDFEDVSAPMQGQVGNFECAVNGGDGVEDMTLKFKTEAVVAALEAQLGRPLLDGEVIPVELSATLKDQPVSACNSGLFGVDNITVINRGKKR